ncbi:hypothetical protein M2322_004767 [Rhodoblastus acidophilus]|uniref:hypothetical protein n=1 Tax=Rhodoblastus acidophilus TaxID=1074 RepID=UPI00222550B8|nr:hypothetical protein [Rhodoblastus acidophilus]MCW2319198.1 hypothetical protein [Rhodoblastus acidophilus]
MRLLVTYDAKAFSTMVAGMNAAASGAFRTQVAGVINKIGHEIHAGLIDPLKHQVGLHGSTIPRAIHDQPAGEGGLAYTLMTRGGDISLHYFGAHEGGGGVSAHPRDQQMFYSGAFMLSGPRGKRAASPKLNGQVYRNVAGGKWGGAIQKVKSGVFIPEEMVRGAARAAFERTVASRLPAEIGRLMTLIVGAR